MRFDFAWRNRPAQMLNHHAFQDVSNKARLLHHGIVNQGDHASAACLTQGEPIFRTHAKIVSIPFSNAENDAIRAPMASSSYGKLRFSSLSYMPKKIVCP